MKAGAMTWLRMAGRLSLLIAIQLLICYLLGWPLFRELGFSSQGVNSVPSRNPNHLNEQAFRRLDVKKGHDLQMLTDWESRSITKELLKEVHEEDTYPLQLQSPYSDQFGNGAGRGRPLHEELKRNVWEVPPAGSIMPPLEEFTLREEMVEFREKKNVIAVTFADHGFLDFVLTWVKRMTDSGVDNLLVGAMDTEMLEALHWAGIPTFDMGTIGMEALINRAGWDTPTFHKMEGEKVLLINAFVALDYEVLVCDADTIWLRDPFPYFDRYPEADVLTSSNRMKRWVDDESLEDWKFPIEVYNIGISYWRPTAAAKQFAAEWMDKLVVGSEMSGAQNWFNHLLRSIRGPRVDDTSGLYWTYHNSLKVGILPVSVFCNFHTFFVQELYKELGLRPYAIHTNFQLGDRAEGKRHQLREAKVFYDPPEYYDVPGNYISFIPSLPENLMTGGAQSVESHFNLVNHQLVQVRSALAIASIMNRTLIMPELWCRFDRLWFPHPGIMPGTHVKQPFLCPMDHIFNVGMWLRDLPNEQYGPAIRFREYSFLDNPRLPSKVRASTVRVNLCELGTDGCSTEPYSELPGVGVLQLPLNSTEVQLKKALSPYAAAEVIEFSSVLGAVGGFSDEATAKRFSNRVKTYTGLWCCLEGFSPGHIWYDIYWDEKPDWKPIPPSNPDDDHPPF